MRKYIFTAIILISIMLAGCDTNAGTVKLTVNETSAEITEVTNEVIHMNNCGGAGEVKQTAERSKSVNVEYAGSFGVDKIVVNGEVSAKYGEINATSKKIELSVPAGKNIDFTLKWTEKTWLGFVTAQGKDGQANYKVSVPISVDLVSSQELICDISNNVPTNPTTLPPATQPPSQTNFSDVYVASNAENGVVFTAPTDGNYRFTIKEGTYCWGGQGKCRSIIHGYLNRDIEWGLWYNLTHPINQDYEIGCWEDQTAANPNCSVGQSAIVAIKAQQYIKWIIMEQKGSFGDDTGNVVLAVEKLP